MYAEITFINDKIALIENLEAIYINGSPVSLTDLKYFFISETTNYTFVGTKNTISAFGGNILFAELVKTNN
jgi:hypothetical protein